jgi:hypothetical protein
MELKCNENINSLLSLNYYSLVFTYNCRCSSCGLLIFGIEYNVIRFDVVIFF